MTRLDDSMEGNLIDDFPIVAAQAMEDDCTQGSHYRFWTIIFMKILSALDVS
jgi:hypothetical protein